MWFWFCKIGIEVHIYSGLCRSLLLSLGTENHKAALKQSRSYLFFSYFLWSAKQKQIEKEKAYKTSKMTTTDEDIHQLLVLTVLVESLWKRKAPSDNHNVRGFCVSEA
jgi:hypothetical protein